MNNLIIQHNQCIIAIRGRKGDWSISHNFRQLNALAQDKQFSDANQCFVCCSSLAFDFINRSFPVIHHHVHANRQHVYITNGVRPQISLYYLQWYFYHPSLYVVSLLFFGHDLHEICNCSVRSASARQHYPIAHSPY